jgi:hypothetical protein
MPRRRAGTPSPRCRRSPSITRESSRTPRASVDVVVGQLIEQLAGEPRDHPERGVLDVAR